MGAWENSQCLIVILLSTSPWSHPCHTAALVFLSLRIHSYGFFFIWLLRPTMIILGPTYVSVHSNTLHFSYVSLTSQSVWIQHSLFCHSLVDNHLTFDSFSILQYIVRIVPFKNDYLYYIYIYIIYMQIYIISAWVLRYHMYTSAQGGQKIGLDPLEINLQEVLSHITWFLGT